LASASSDKTVNLWHTTNWTLAKTFKGHSGSVNGLEYLFGNLLASGSKDAKVKIWDINTGNLNMTITCSSAVMCLKLLPDGKLASGQQDGTVKLWNPIDGSLFKTLSNSPAYSANDIELIGNQTLIVSKNDMKICVYDLASYSLKFILTGHQGPVNGLKIINECNLLVSSSDDNSINIWDMSNGNLIQTLRNHTGFIQNSLDIYGNVMLISGSNDKTIKLWQMNLGSFDYVNTFQTNLTIRSLAVIDNMQSIL
jgi:WD40 repeat protein